MEQTVQSLRDLRKGIFNERSKDLLLAFLIALIGLAGSYLVLGKSIRDRGITFTALPADDRIVGGQEEASTSAEGLSQSAYQFRQEALLVQGSMLVGQITRISNLAFDPRSSYLLDYGNGIRHRMTSPTMSIRYEVPGIYLLQCYVLEGAKWKLLSAETITIRRPQHQNWSEH
ncbi:MAG: hypothetical protein IT266_06075 [Saprospiraceae bacterium]|nr:hypothetical protein [Saprospiraceae bacterium]